MGLDQYMEKITKEEAERSETVRLIIVKLLNMSKPMHYSNGDIMGHVSKITFSEEEKKILQKWVKA